MKDRIQALLQEINKGIYEKETELAMALMAALAGESIILLGTCILTRSTKSITAHHGCIEKETGHI